MAIISRETLRRMALLIALPVGALLIAWPASSLLALSRVDWEVKRRHEIAALLSDEARRDLNVYIREQTEGHVVTLSAAQWRTFIGQARETQAGRPPTPAWNAAAEWSEYYHKVRRAYLDPGQILPAKLLALPEMASGYAYLKLEGEQSTPPGLFLERIASSVTHSGAPQHLIFPLRHAGWWLILGGLLVYGLIPWPRPAANQFCPITPAMAFLIDLVGAILYGTFLGIWSKLILEPSIPGHGEWSQIIVFTMIFWGMALAGVAILIVALWYITFCFQWDDDGLRLRTLLGDKFQPWEDIQGLSLQPVVYRFAKRFRAVALFLSVFNWRVAGPALLMQTESVCLHLSMREGDGWHVDLGNLSPQGLAGLVNALRARRISVSPQVAHLSTSVDTAKHRPRLLPIYLTILVLAAFVSYALWRTMPPSVE